jgi:hypothetical protein
MADLFKLAVEIAKGSSTPGLVILLTTLLGIALWAYWRERRQNQKVSDQRLTEARQDTEAMTSALHEATHAVETFRASNEALKHAIELMLQTRGAP